MTYMRMVDQDPNAPARKAFAMAQIPKQLGAYLKVHDAVEEWVAQMPPRAERSEEEHLVCTVFHLLSHKNHYMKHKPGGLGRVFLERSLEMHGILRQGGEVEHWMTDHAWDSARAADAALEFLGMQPVEPLVLDYVLGVKRAAEAAEGLAYDMLGDEFHPRNWAQRPTSVPQVEDVVLRDLAGRSRAMVPVAPVQSWKNGVRVKSPEPA